MNFDLSEWANLLIRWIHVFAGILWIGQTYFFTWLDARLTEAIDLANQGGSGNVWMVHSGGFYAVKKQYAPPHLGEKLHWFRWEAAVTWISGIGLLILVYYAGGLMVDETVANTTLATSIGIGISVLVGSWVLYDFLWKSKLANVPAVATLVSYLLIVALAYGLCRLMSGRAAYIHVGGALGTIMAANVWLRILPAQRQLVGALKTGNQPNAALALRAKTRSKHNTFIVVPVVLIMLSNHFPTATYGNSYNWLVLAALVLVGWGAASFIRR